MNICTDHPQQPFSLICVAQHYCQRKLCQECKDEHGVDSKQLLSIHKFQEKVKKRVEKFNLNTQISQQNYTSLHLNFKSLLVQSEEMIKTVYQNLTQSINKIFDMIEQEDQYYHNILNPLTNPLEYSYLNLNKLVEIIKENTLENWNSQKDSYLIQLNKVRQWLDIEMSNFVGKFNGDQIKDLESIIKIEKIESKDDYYWQEGIKEYECWKYISQNSDLIPVKAKFTVTKTKNKEIIYSSDGMKQRMQDIFIGVSNKKPELLKNLDQIEYFQWVGEYGNNNKKVGKWIATWKDQSLYGFGGLYRRVQKTFIYILIMVKSRANGKNQYQIFAMKLKFMNLENMQMMREMEDGSTFIQQLKLVVGCIVKKKLMFFSLILFIFFIWVVLFFSSFINQIQKVKTNQIYSLNQYLENGKKNGQWIELSDNFWRQNNFIYSSKIISLSQITYHGQFQNGNKLGKWDIHYQNELIGGGLLLENGQKNGYWEEQSENFYCDCQVTYNGTYKKGVKIGRWNTNYRYNSNEQFEQIGGGIYDDHGIKNGKWIELSEKFRNLHQVIYHGYFHTGKKYGKWEEMERNKWMMHQGFKKIGEQKYEDSCVFF